MSIPLENMPPEIRMAGVAYVVSEFVDIPRVGLSPEAEAAIKHRSHQYAHHWAVMRGWAMDDVVDYEYAIQDAITYREEHAEDVARFLLLRERGLL